MSKKPRVTVTERDQQADLKVLLSDPRYKARLDNPFGAPSSPIALKDQTRECRWFNAAIQEDHIWRNKRKGWDQVKPTDVDDLEQLGGYSVSPEGFIVRGERGREILMSMPKEVVRAVRAAKTEHNNRTVGRAGVLHDELSAAVGNKYGDEAGQFVHTHVKLDEKYEVIPEDKRDYGVTSVKE